MSAKQLQTHHMLKDFGPSLYVASGPTVSFYGFRYPTHMAVARLSDGSAWVSPKRLRITSAIRSIADIQLNLV